MPVSQLVPAVASVLLFLPSCPSAAISPGLGMPWAANGGDFMWEDEFYPIGRKPSTYSLNPRVTWLGKGGTQNSDGAGGGGGGAGLMGRGRGGGVAMVKRHPSAAMSYVARKRQSYLTMPYHPLARFRGVDSQASSLPVIGPYRPSPPFVLPLGVASNGPRAVDAAATELEPDGTDDDEFEKGADIGGLSAAQLLSLIASVAKDRGFGPDRGRLSKGIRFGMNRRR